MCSVLFIKDELSVNSRSFLAKISSESEIAFKYLKIFATIKVITVIGFYRSLRLTDDKLVTPKLPLQSQLTALHTVEATVAVSRVYNQN